ncbi:hypothetical protein AMTRI_Chr06g194240 [Amborella trichopoda]
MPIKTFCSFPKQSSFSSVHRSACLSANVSRFFVIIHVIGLIFLTKLCCKPFPKRLGELYGLPHLTIRNEWKLECLGSPLPFVGPIVSAIKIISGLILLGKHDSPSSSSRGKSYHLMASKILKWDVYKELSQKEKASILIKNGTSHKVCRDYQSLSYSQIKEPVHSKEKAKGLNGRISSINGRCLSEDVECKSVDSQDPFAFDKYDMETSKWEQLSSIYKHTSHSQNTVNADTDLDDEHELKLATRINGKAVNGKACHVSVDSCSSMIAEEDILDYCLRAAIELAEDLTLIVGHFPIFHLTLSLSHDNEDITPSLKIETCDLDQNDYDYLSDHEMELLVAIFGVLINLVEDTGNRTQLAAARGSRQAAIPLLCSIIWANQGAGETHEGEKMIVEAYAALRLAFLSNESDNAREANARCLPKHSLRALVPVLERLVAFHITLNMISPYIHAIVCEVIESCRMP